MEKQETIMDRVKLPTRVIVQRFPITPAALSAATQKGELAVEGGVTCELEVGGQVLARGRIVQRRGSFFFKVTAIGEEEGK
jgi:hypothetical protein